MSWFKEYDLMMSLEEAAERLSEPGCAIIGGGSRLVAAKPDGIETLIDLMPLGLDRVRPLESGLMFEARVRLQDLVARKDYDGLLGKAILSLAHSENLRNQMTVAGETAWPLGLNEWQVALLALDAIIHRHNEHDAPAREYMASKERTGIITAVSLPARDGWRFGFDRVAPAEGARPFMTFAGAAKLAGDRIEDLRLALGNLGPYPQRMRALEDRLRGEATALPPGTGRNGRGAEASFRLQAGDCAGIQAIDSHNAGLDAKWQWTEAMVGRFLASLAEAGR
jgi:CO/xanthine dehydrogenase FAD-binding subunit